MVGSSKTTASAVKEATTPPMAMKVIRFLSWRFVSIFRLRWWNCVWKMMIRWCCVAVYLRSGERVHTTQSSIWARKLRRLCQRIRIAEKTIILFHSIHTQHGNRGEQARSISRKHNNVTRVWLSTCGCTWKSASDPVNVESDSVRWRQINRG